MKKQLFLTLTVFFFTPSLIASSCFTITSNNNPSSGDVTCKRVARSSTNGIGFWRCCPKSGRNHWKKHSPLSSLNLNIRHRHLAKHSQLPLGMPKVMRLKSENNTKWLEFYLNKAIKNSIRVQTMSHCRELTNLGACLLFEKLTSA